MGIQKKSSLQSKWALVTGASSGIGASTAKRLADQGCHLLLLARRRDRLEQLVNEINNQFISELKKPPEIHILCGDLSDLSSLDELLQSSSQLISRVQILVNNAGLAKGTQPVQNSSWRDWEEMIDVNLRGLFRLTQSLLPHLEKNSLNSLDPSHIVNLGSVAGRLIYPGGAVYCATKFAVRAFSEGLRMDLLGKNIRVTNIEPGMVNTEFSLVRLGDQVKADQVYEGMTPLSAEDVAESIVWSLDRPRHVNIQEMVIYPTDQASVGQVYRSK
jgi:3-hydroxy acid dehydrogenase/malonic semialdehyde reductase